MCRNYAALILMINSFYRMLKASAKDDIIIIELKKTNYYTAG